MAAIMQVVILAGGLGTRLGALTKDTPKPLMPVAGRPYLAWQLDWLAAQGFQDVLLLTGYLGEQVEEALGDGSAFGLRLSYSREPEPLGTGGALRLAVPLLHESFLVLYGDSFLPIDLRKTAALLTDTQATGLLVVYHDPTGETTVPCNVALEEDGLHVAAYRKGVADPALRHVEAGVLAFRRDMVSLLPSQGRSSLEEEIFPRLIQARQLVAQVTEQRFYDIGTPERLEQFEEEIDSFEAGISK
jgi:NDP-sugar pyrophosphorylase family protein